MRQAIHTKYRCPTNHRGAGIVAHAGAGKAYVPYDYELTIEQNHSQAAKLYASEHGWQGTLAGGCLPDGSYAFVFI